MHSAAISVDIEPGVPFAWLPVKLIAQALETANRLGMPVADIEGRRRELILGLESGASLRMIVAADDPTL